MGGASTSPARGRIESLLDTNSFVEIGADITARNTDFNLNAKKSPSDGVITGYGLIEGRPVYIYSQDNSVLNGTMGEMHAGKIIRMYKLALKTGDPVIGLIDCAGMRLEEGLDGLHAFGKIWRVQSEASGVIPQITAVFGMCGGGMALVPSLSDFTFIEKDKGRLFLQAPNALPGNSEEACDTSAPDFRFSQGETDGYGSSEEIMQKIRDVLSYLPSNNEEEIVSQREGLELNTVQEDLDRWVSDPAQILQQISDTGRVCEVKAGYAPEMYTAFSSIGGYTAGIIANRQAVYGPDGLENEYAPVLTAAGAEKASRFLSFCDAFSIPVISFVNVTGMDAGISAETALLKTASKLAYTAARADTVRISVITGKAYGTAALLMNSRSLGADLVYAWKDAKTGLMDAKAAAKILSDSAETSEVQKIAEQYDSLQNSAGSAAARGYIDTVIDPSETRKYLIGALDMLFTKRSGMACKKHEAF